MAWARLDDSFDTHPKILELGSDQRRWTWLRLLIYTTRYRSPIVPENVAQLVPRASRAFIADCERIGLLDRLDSGQLAVHDWNEYQGADSKLQVRERVKRFRERQSETVTEALPPALQERDSRVGAARVPSRPTRDPLSLEGSIHPTPERDDDLDLEPVDELLTAWRRHAAATPGVRSVEALAQHGYRSGEWPPAVDAAPRGLADPSKVCTDCGETYGAGHLETCPQILRHVRISLDGWTEVEPT